MENRLPDPSEICAPEFKGEFRRFGIGSVSATIETNWSIFSDGRRLSRTKNSQKRPSRGTSAKCSQGAVLAIAPPHAAYHQGTVWAWLIGPFIDAWLKVQPEERETAWHFLDAVETHIGEAGIGSISEVFDVEPPFTPRGCVAHAWSVAEVCRALVKTAG